MNSGDPASHSRRPPLTGYSQAISFPPWPGVPLYGLKGIQSDGPETPSSLSNPRVSDAVNDEESESIARSAVSDSL